MSDFGISCITALPIPVYTPRVYLAFDTTPPRLSFIFRTGGINLKGCKKTHEVDDAKCDCDNTSTM